MAEAHALLNGLDEAGARAALRRACGAESWVLRMSRRRPYASLPELLRAAAEEWDTSSTQDYLEAFAHHPQIGEDLAELERRFGGTANLSKREQAGVSGASGSTLLALRDKNRAYRERFGFTFIICATGKTADEMLEQLQARLENDRDVEIAIAAAEQAKITRLRLEQLAA
jgi:2-oxo-4-hydroxy-4-carboxy-5-ureidoimidazoline decarboxylase